jgi:stage III sporulation protein SpoIIIAA
MREVVQNHTPQVMIIDEIATRDQCNAAGSISQRGVQMVIYNILFFCLKKIIN